MSTALATSATPGSFPLSTLSLVDSSSSPGCPSSPNSGLSVSSSKSSSTSVDDDPIGGSSNSTSNALAAPTHTQTTVRPTIVVLDTSPSLPLVAASSSSFSTSSSSAVPEHTQTTDSVVLLAPVANNSDTQTHSCPNVDPDSTPSSPGLGPSVTHTQSYLQHLSQKCQHYCVRVNRGRLVVSIKWAGLRVKKVMSSFSKSTILLGMVLATICSIPAWKGLEIQAWTSRKDFLQYCKDELLNLVGSAWDHCDEAIKTGLPPPPRHLKRSATPNYQPHTKAIWRRTSTNPATRANTRSNTNSTIMDIVFTEASQHFWITWLFWFCVSIVLTVQTKRGVRILSRASRTTLFDRSQLLLNPILTTCIITLSVVVLVSAQSRWVATKQQEAIYEYCQSAPTYGTIPFCARTTYPQVFQLNVLNVPVYVFTFELFLTAAIVLCMIVRIKEYWSPARTSIHDLEATRENRTDVSQASLQFLQTGIVDLNSMPYRDLESLSLTAHNDPLLAAPPRASIEQIVVVAHTNYSGDSQSTLQQTPGEFVAEEQESFVSKSKSQSKLTEESITAQDTAIHDLTSIILSVPEDHAAEEPAQGSSKLSQQAEHSQSVRLRHYNRSSGRSRSKRHYLSPEEIMYAKDIVVQPPRSARITQTLPESIVVRSRPPGSVPPLTAPNSVADALSPDKCAASPTVAVLEEDDVRRNAKAPAADSSPLAQVTREFEQLVRSFEKGLLLSLEAADAADLDAARRGEVRREACRLAISDLSNRYTRKHIRQSLDTAESEGKRVEEQLHSLTLAGAAEEANDDLGSLHNGYFRLYSTELFDLLEQPTNLRFGSLRFHRHHAGPESGAALHDAQSPWVHVELALNDSFFVADSIETLPYHIFRLPTTPSIQHQGILSRKADGDGIFPTFDSWLLFTFLGNGCIKLEVPIEMCADIYGDRLRGRENEEVLFWGFFVDDD